MEIKSFQFTDITKECKLNKTLLPAAWRPDVGLGIAVRREIFPWYGGPRTKCSSVNNFKQTSPELQSHHRRSHGATCGLWAGTNFTPTNYPVEMFG